MIDQDPFKTGKEKKTISETWMVTFGDLLALLLTFFVLMFSMNSVQVSKWQAVVQSLSENLNPERAKIEDKDWEKVETALVEAKSALTLTYLKKVLDDKLQYDPILQRSTVTQLDDRLAISLPSDLIFEKGSSELSEDALQSLMELAEGLRYIRNRLEVVGHTDLEPVSGVRYPSNWELSLVRAVEIARMIKEAGYDQDIVALGNGESRFSDLSEDIPLDQRYKLARRVDVIIHKEGR